MCSFWMCAAIGLSIPITKYFCGPTTSATNIPSTPPLAGLPPFPRQQLFSSIQSYQDARSGLNPRSYTSVDAIIGDSRVGYISNFYDIFAQDAWQVRPSLLLTYGLRYDRFVSPSANPNAPYAFSRQFRNPSRDISPRLGLAWRFSDKTVVRSSPGGISH